LLDSILIRYLPEDRAEVIRQLESDLQERRSAAGVPPPSNATASTQMPSNSVQYPELADAVGFPQYANASPAHPNYANFVPIPQPGVQVINFNQLNWPQDWATQQAGIRNPKFNGTE
jgi:hypothetical protein